MDGVDYAFLTHADFEKGIAKGAFAEFEKIHGNYYYGTLKSTLDETIQRQELLLLELDVKGAMSIKNLFPDKTISIFVEPPSLNDLRKRLLNRGTDSEERIAKRLERLGAELEYKSNFNYHVINDDVERAVDEIMNIIQHENEGVTYGA